MKRHIIDYMKGKKFYYVFCGRNIKESFYKIPKFYFDRGITNINGDNICKECAKNYKDLKQK